MRMQSNWIVNVVIVFRKVAFWHFVRISLLFIILQVEKKQNAIKSKENIKFYTVLMLEMHR